MLLEGFCGVELLRECASFEMLLVVVESRQ